MTTIPLTHCIDFGPFGGAELFFGDIDGDGRTEIVAYQGPGVFGARLYAAEPCRAPFMPRSQCVSAFDLAGRRLWTWGKPNPPDRIWISHAYESCVSLADADGDGRMEVVVALGDAVVVLDGCTGYEKRSARLPEDYYYIVHALGQSVADGEAALVVKNGEGGYDGPYGQPVLGLQADLTPAWGPREIAGAGHHLRNLPSAADGAPQYLIGYCAVRPDGSQAWIADILRGRIVDNAGQHVDYLDTWTTDDGRLLLAFAGSDLGYLVENGGRTLWTIAEGHMQGVAFGRFNGAREPLVAFYCAPDGPVVLCDLQGRRQARFDAPRLDEEGCPLVFPDGRPRRFHRNRPVVAARGSAADWLVFADGGWPWGMDGAGGRTLRFAPPAAEQRVDWSHPPVGNALRMDDLGFSYAVKTIPLKGGGPDSVLIYNRRHLWRYDLP